MKQFWLRSFLAMFALFSCFSFASEQTDTTMSEEEKQYVLKLLGEWQAFEKKTGSIELPNGVATLTVPEDFVYIGPEDANLVLTAFWGNPPGSKNLGMLFPVKYTPIDPEAWGVEISYEEEGYISDKDAAEIDYSEMLQQMKKDTAQTSKYRVKQGYPSIELVGWADKPYYDQETKKLYWAKELKFDNSPDHSLNYDIRILGRKGVLNMSFIAGMEQLTEIQLNREKVLAMANFNEGMRYEDFDPSVDKVAAYGIGALVAGKVLAKTGLLAAAVLFLKKFWFVIVAGLFGVAKLLFGRKKQQES